MFVYHMKNVGLVFEPFIFFNFTLKRHLKENVVLKSSVTFVRKHQRKIVFNLSVNLFESQVRLQGKCSNMYTFVRIFHSQEYYGHILQNTQ